MLDYNDGLGGSGGSEIANMADQNKKKIGSVPVMKATPKSKVSRNLATKTGGKASSSIVSQLPGKVSHAELNGNQDDIECLFLQRPLQKDGYNAHCVKSVHMTIVRC